MLKKRYPAQRQCKSGSSCNGRHVCFSTAGVKRFSQSCVLAKLNASSALLFSLSLPFLCMRGRRAGFFSILFSQASSFKRSLTSAAAAVISICFVLTSFILLQTSLTRQHKISMHSLTPSSCNLSLLQAAADTNKQCVSLCVRWEWHSNHNIRVGFRAKGAKITRVAHNHDWITFARCIFSTPPLYPRRM